MAGPSHRPSFYSKPLFEKFKNLPGKNYNSINESQEKWEKEDNLTSLPGTDRPFIPARIQDLTTKSEGELTQGAAFRRTVARAGGPFGSAW